MACFILAEDFIQETKERTDLNQYWYSPTTIETLVGEIQDLYDDDETNNKDPLRNLAALVSCPSIYFALPEHLKSRCVVLDLDTQWKLDPGYHCYDFNIHPNQQLPSHLQNNFKLIIVDPPFVTREVWEQYAISSKWLGTCNNCRYICTTIHENAKMMKSLLNLTSNQFRPSIPSLVYQYSTYTNYTSERLNVLNPEIDQIDWALAAAEEEQQRQQENNNGGSKSSYSEDDRKISKRQDLENNEEWKSMPVVESKTNMAPVRPEIEVLLHLRTNLGHLKSTGSTLNKTIQQLIINIKSKNSQQRIKTVNDTLNELSQQIESVCLDWENNVLPISELLGNVNNIEITSHTNETKQLITDVSLCLANDITKNNLTKFVTRNKKIQSNVFRKQGIILALIKNLKTKK